MKTHAIIPLFIPHLGCPHACAFCNQQVITARQHPPTIQQVEETIETWLSTLEHRPGIQQIDLAFYGGSFTGIPAEQQEAYLSVAKDYKAAGRIREIHLSTRPDCIDEATLDRLAHYTVDAIELGAQSFDDAVLRETQRGHTAAQTRHAAALIHQRGITLGIQLMVGLPGETRESCIYSAEETLALGGKLGRIYPLVILSGTPLASWYRAGAFQPISQEEAVLRAVSIYRRWASGGMQILRVGLKSTDLMAPQDSESSAILGGAYHPAFRQLVESAIAREDMEMEISEFLAKMPPEFPSNHGNSIVISAHSSWISNLSGHQGTNRKYFLAKYPQLQMIFQSDPTLPRGKITLSKKEY